MLMNMSISAIENFVTPESLILYLALLCVLAAAALAVGIALRRHVLR